MNTGNFTETRQYLTFKLGEESFALDVAEAREILDVSTITRVPRMPDFMCGVINLRGNVVPVLDMRLKFGMSRTEKTVDTCIIVVEMRVLDEPTVIGALVDSVEEVFDLDPDRIEPAPKIGNTLKTGFIKGMGRHNDRFIIILDINNVFSSGDLADIKDAGAVLEIEEPVLAAG